MSSQTFFFLRRGKKNDMVLVYARTTFASRTALFFYFPIPLFSFLLARKLTVCGEKIRYLIIITVYGLYAKKWRLFAL